MPDINSQFADTTSSLSNLGLKAAVVDLNVPQLVDPVIRAGDAGVSSTGASSDDWAPFGMHLREALRILRGQRP